MAVLTVGAGEEFSTLGAAVSASSGGDTILVDAGLYVDDFTTIGHALTIEGVGGLAHFLANSSPTNGKAIMTVDADLTIGNLEFSGAAVPDGNGAGLRYEAGTLAIVNSWFHDNQNGLLAASDPSGAISIDHSEFNNNGTDTGLTHNLYVNDVASLTITNSYFHDVNVGHEIKSRAETTVIANNVIADGPDRSASYSIDLPNGGAATITGNVIEKGAQAQNWTFISYGEEGSLHAASTLGVTDNTIINDLASGDPTIVRNPAEAAVELANNIIYGVNASQEAIGPVTSSGNTYLSLPGPAIDTSHPFATPEPGSLGLLMLGAAVVTHWRRAHFRRAAKA